MNTNTETPRDTAVDVSGVDTTPNAPCETRGRYEAAAQALSEALGRKKAMTERAARMTRASEAAQAQANAVCAQWRELLRQADGEITREIQKLRASERSSLTLMEEYAAMHKEIQGHMTSIELEVAELAEKSIRERNKVLELASREAFDALMAQACDAMATAYVLHRRAALSPLLAQFRPSDEQVLAGFLHQLGQQINMRSSAVNDAVVEVIGVRGLELDGVDMTLAASPARRANHAVLRSHVFSGLA
ncbi:hypothetical protein [Xanthomonas vesicatoria]|uniref:Uncharacterized protein n=1 Tax=Xanthomonas vesicatoria TaxID=56460 RepID=A0ABS8L5D8_9XANT|nr:hypothetical protein [Xanthomonas vesicatoria]MCC8620940.1 hypothetical protein [Xanthomonas vesicatoria]